jgi:glyoxylase-like metal-dependent hydrolase (beta-lactamase superfamily II)
VIKGYVNQQNIVERVETWAGDNIMGDMHVLAVYSGWKDFGGVMAPSRIVETRGEWPYFEVTVTAAKANPPDLATLGAPPPPAGRGGGAAAPAAGAPAGGGRGGDGGRGGAGGGRGGAGGGGRGGDQPAAARGAVPAPAAAPPAAQAAGGFTVTSEKLGDGLYRLTSTPSGYDSMIVEFKNYIMMLEAGQGTAQNPQGRAVAYLAEIKKLYPNKPIRYVFNTHPHSDHTGGLPVVVAQGATIITQQNNVLFFERALNTPRTLLNDPLAKTPRKVKVEGVAEKKVYSDGTRTVEFYHVPNAPHSNGLLFAYIPKEKVLFQGDFTVTDGQPANDHVKALFPVLEKLNLDFNRYIPVHTAAAPQTKADVWKSMGK